MRLRNGVDDNVPSKETNVQSILAGGVASFITIVLAFAGWGPVGNIALAQLAAESAPAHAPPEIPVDKFAKLHTLIKPQPGELRFHDIPWLIDVWEARKQAAALSKPIL